MTNKTNAPKAEEKDKNKVKNTAKNVLDRLAKRQPVGSIVRGTKIYPWVPRLPTGIWKLTHALGGGYPFWAGTNLMGAESSGKTSAVYDAMKQASILCWRCFNIHPYCTCDDGPMLQKVLLCNPEAIFDKPWFDSWQINPKSFWVVESLDGNTHADIAAEFLQASDGGAVFIDSIAQLLPRTQEGRSIGDDQIGDHAKLIKSMVNRFTLIMSRERTKGHPCLVVGTNQLRSKIGVMFGSNETETGGRAWRFWYSMSVRLSKLSSQDSEFTDKNSGLRYRQKHGFILGKKKFWVAAGKGEYARFTDDFKKGDDILFRKGLIPDHKVFVDDMLTFGLAYKDNSSIHIPLRDIQEKSEKALRRRLLQDPLLYYQLQIDVMRMLTERRMQKP